ncbi:MAG: HEAT repeat domain-containing protein [Kofleriaceae bacterium]
MHRRSLVVTAAALAGVLCASCSAPPPRGSTSVLLRLPPPPRPDTSVRGASYLVAISQHIQPAWAQYLENCRLILDRDHPLNTMSLAATAELVVDRTGHLELVGLVTSRNDEFDRAIRGLLADARHVEPPPTELLSDDDRVHVQWLFARDHRQAGPATATVTTVELPLLGVTDRLVGQGELARAAGRVAASAADDPDRLRAAERVMIAVLREAVEAPSTNARRAAVEAAQDAQLHALAPVLVGLAATATDLEVRGAAIAALGALGDRSHIELLERLLVTELRAQTRLAVVATRALVALGASDIAAEAIRAALEAGPASGRLVALQCHGVAPTPALAATLSGWFRRGDARMRASVCTAIAADAGPIAILLKGLGDADATVRATCADAAARRRSLDRATVRRLRELTHDRDHQVRAAAVIGLSTREPVLGALSDPASEVRRAAAAAASEPELQTLAGDADPEVRAAAIMQLGSRAPELTARAATDLAAQVRRAAALVISDPSLLARLVSDPSPDVAAAALGRLVTLRGRAAMTSELLRQLAPAPAGTIERVRIARAWLLGH